MSITIQLSDGRQAYRPGETLSGRVGWQLDRRPRSLEIVLFWHTEGKGSRDSGVAERLVREDPGERGEMKFSFTLPAAPVSFSGKLVGLIWSVEALFPKEKAHEHVDFTLSPTGAPIELGSAKGEAPGSRFSPGKFFSQGA